MDNKKELSPKKNEEFRTFMEDIGKVMIAKMNDLEIPNFMEAYYEYESDHFSLKFERNPLKSKKK